MPVRVKVSVALSARRRQTRGQAVAQEHKHLVTLRRAVALLLAGLLMAGCGQDGGLVFVSHQRKAAERLLGVPLPAGAQDVRFYRYQHGGEFGDVDEYSAYLKFQASHSDYLEFMQRLGIVVRPGSAPELRARLPGHWKLAPGLHLDWWEPTLDIPDDTGLGSFGANGFLVAKRERGFVYLKASDYGDPVSEPESTQRVHPGDGPVGR